MEEGFKYQKVDTATGQQANLLGDEIANVTRCRGPLAFKQLGPRDGAGDQSLVFGGFASNAYGSGIDRLGLFPIASSVQLFPGSEEGERLQNLRSGVEKFVM